jgi:very-short-patch-repair endonuclease
MEMIFAYFHTPRLPAIGGKPPLSRGPHTPSPGCAGVHPSQEGKTGTLIASLKNKILEEPIMKGKIIYYNPALTKKARILRKKSTPAEILLWKRLKKKQLLGYDFHRQKPIDKYIVDFFCPKLKIAIEIDGISHNDKVEYDRKRESDLKKLGIHILRFTEKQVRININVIVLQIENYINDIMKNFPSGEGCPAIAGRGVWRSVAYNLSSGS